MATSAQTLAQQALISTQNVGIPLTKALVDKTPLGSFWVRVGVAIGTSDTNIAIQLPRIPSMYLVVRNSSDAVVYDGSTPSAWTSLNFTLRASVATTVSLLIG